MARCHYRLIGVGAGVSTIRIPSDNTQNVIRTMFRLTRMSI